MDGPTAKRARLCIADIVEAVVQHVSTRVGWYDVPKVLSRVGVHDPCTETMDRVTEKLRKVRSVQVRRRKVRRRPYVKVDNIDECVQFFERYSEGGGVLRSHLLWSYRGIDADLATLQDRGVIRAVPHTKDKDVSYFHEQPHHLQDVLDAAALYDSETEAAEGERVVREAWNKGRADWHELTQPGMDAAFVDLKLQPLRVACDVPAPPVKAVKIQLHHARAILDSMK